MTESISWQERYLNLIDHIIEITLQGKIRSKEQVYQMLVKEISSGTGEIFERCFDERFQTIKNQVDIETDELKQAKANRRLRALKTIQGEWEKWEKQNQTQEAIATSIQQIINTESRERLTSLLNAIDPNQKQPLTLNQIQKLGQTLHDQKTQTTDSDLQKDLQQFTTGITKGLEAWQRLQPYLVSWIYDQSRGQLGFGGTPEQRGPWVLWSKQVNSSFPEGLFNTIALEKSIVEFAGKASIEGSDLVELAIILQCLQRGLVEWFDKLIYDAKVGAKLSISTFLTFAAIWCQLADGFQARPSLNNSCFQVTLQILRAFSQREYFPLYGGIFASFSGEYLQNALSYLDEPLQRIQGTQAKGRILTLLGYSQQTLGQYLKAMEFHKQALKIAQETEDKSCEIANLNHLSRTCVAMKDYGEAINYSQRALMFSRQVGDKRGEANALANFAFSEVFQARQQEVMETEVYETAINYLQQGLKLSENLGDGQSKSLCFSSLGIAFMVLEKPEDALLYLAGGWQAAQYSGDLYLQGLNLAYLAQAYYSLQNLEQAVFAGCLGMYLLEQIGSNEWRQTAGLMVVLKGQLGEDFNEILEQKRSEILPVIGVDGYDYIPALLVKYQQSL
ncbi:MAG: tetratricopeptide repeat protein [Okeania sp. SIO3I5]|uniref:tetratricopeptide repeat protein n=1 Tax=Okeania sp. SIO3I5 TaxID=2607805 RepID=UPI0013B801F4|nr:tetratricopeptide repeat protein [Okeania sp. SIO3I5]NEQ35176.1 tetratricopeptide repeat protein [Okeania sp. SIO3I5]